MIPNRPLTQAEYDEVVTDLEALRKCGLSDADMDFIKITAGRAAEFGRLTRFSARQSKQLERIRMMYL